MWKSAKKRRMPLCSALNRLWKGLWEGIDSYSVSGGQGEPVGAVWIAERSSST
jgi:hypothetical protein